MRLKPVVTKEEALEFLSMNATLSYGLDEAARLAPTLREIAGVMVALSQFELEDATEPLFGEDIAAKQSGEAS